MEQTDPPAKVASNDQLGLVPKRDIVGLLRGLERQGEDNIWRVAQQAREEIETLRSQLAHWKTFAIHAEGEHAAWKKIATEQIEPPPTVHLYP